jgi:hypothetical protein
MSKTIVAVLGLVALVVLCVMLRRSPVEGKPLRSAARGLATPRVEETQATPPKSTAVAAVRVAEGNPAVKAAVRSAQEKEQEFWADLGTMTEIRGFSQEPERHRRQMIHSTAKHLGLEGAEAAVFQQTALQALMLLGEAWKIRDAEFLSLPPGLQNEERARREQELQDRYEDAKRLELQRIEATLSDSVRHVLFRERIAEWVDSVR